MTSTNTPVQICRHIKTNGCRCRSPRLTGRDLCYFHARFYERQDSMVRSHSPLGTGNATYAPTILPIEIDLPILEDAESIQVSISLLVAALARNRIDAKRAAVLLYGLQLASTNAKSITTEPFSAAVVRNIIQSNSLTDLAVGDSGLSAEENALFVEGDDEDDDDAEADDYPEAEADDDDDGDDEEDEEPDDLITTLTAGSPMHAAGGPTSRF
jgi:hypothetical protein